LFQLQVLREKAANRNEDEFYFKMINTKTVDGVHRPVYVTNYFLSFRPMSR